jgi:hypothetical protein
MPGGNCGRRSVMAALTRSTTALAFSPCCIMAMPTTVSPAASRLTAPRRTLGASTTSPRVPTVTGRPPAFVATTMLAMSAGPLARPRPRITSCWSLCSI